MTASTPAPGPASVPVSGHVSTHVLDTRLGRPAADVPVRLDAYDGNTWRPLAEGATDADGRWSAPPSRDADAGAARAAAGSDGDGSGGDGGGAATYRLRFGTGPYFAGLGVATFYPEVSVIFTIADLRERQHVPLLLSPFGYSTYRGS